MSVGMFENEMMGPERVANRKLAAELLEGGDADYDRMSRSGSFLNDDGGGEFMPRGSIGGGDEDFLGNRPLLEPEPRQGLAQIEEESDSDDEVAVRPRDGRINSMRRAGATSLAPMAFGRERAGTEVGAMTAPWSPNIHRDQELDEEAHDEMEVALKRHKGVKRGALQAAILRARMEGDSELFGNSPAIRPAHTSQELQEMGQQMGYQHGASSGLMANLDPKSQWQFWRQADPDQPDQGAFMSAPDAGWDRVTSRGFLGLPYLFSKLGSKLFGTKGGRYDRRKADLARRNGTFERAWETYGATREGRKGVMPDWIQDSDWARRTWQQRSRGYDAEEDMEMARQEAKDMLGII